MQIPFQQHTFTQPQPFLPPQSTHGMFGFKARMFPLFGAILATVTVLWTYIVALHRGHVKPFPDTDITHTAIKYPEYVIFRIGMMVTPVLFSISFQILKNFIMIKSFEITGKEQRRVRHFGPLAVGCCLFLCLSTGTISDGKDMDWTSHTIGATSFFILSMYMCLVASKIYRELYYMDKSLCSEWSFYVKKYNGWAIVFFLGLTALDSFKVISIGSFVEWAATFYLILYFASLYDDFKDIDIMMERTKGTELRQIVMSQ